MAGEGQNLYGLMGATRVFTVEEIAERLSAEDVKVAALEAFEANQYANFAMADALKAAVAAAFPDHDLKEER